MFSGLAPRVRGRAGSRDMTIGATVRQANLHTLFTAAYGAPVGPQRLRLFTTGYFHSSDPNVAACYVGGFASGTVIDWFHSGSICGARGIPNSGSGGHCIVGQPGVTINLRNFGTIFAGGGAGGYGGTGGMGFYITTGHLGQSGAHYWCDLNSSCVQTFGDPAYCSPNDISGGYCNSCACICWACYRDYTTYTYGGGGGSGGYGTGVYDAAGNQASATGGAPGAGGDTNAGSGGYGGDGGGWGGAGGTGATANSGNYTGGSGGSGGGSAGYWRVSNGSPFNLISNGGNIAGNAN